MENCIFCKIVSGEIPSYKIYEDDEVIAFLDVAPVNSGHVLVVPKSHYKNLLDIPQDLVCQVIAVVKKLAPSILEGVGAKDFNLHLNNGNIAGQTVEHFHWHIIPRFPDDGKELWHGNKYKEGEAQQLMDKIKSNLNGY